MALSTAVGLRPVGMVTITAGAVVNAVLDPVFIFVLNQGGCGEPPSPRWSPQLVSALWVMKFLTGKRALIPLRREQIRWQPDILKDTVQLGFSHFIMSFTNAVTQSAHIYARARPRGRRLVGGHDGHQPVREVVTMPANGLTGGAQPVLGYNYGAGEYDRVKRGILFMTAVCLGYMLVAWGLVFCFPP